MGRPAKPVAHQSLLYAGPAMVARGHFSLVNNRFASVVEDLIVADSLLCSAYLKINFVLCRPITSNIIFNALRTCTYCCLIKFMFCEIFYIVLPIFC